MSYLRRRPQLPLRRTQRPTDQLLLYGHPEQKEVNQQAYVTSLRQFLDLKLHKTAYSDSDKIPWAGSQFYPHQVFSAMYMTIHDRLLVMDETGTGKMYVAMAIGETLRRAAPDPALGYLNHNMKTVDKLYQFVSTSVLRSETAQKMRALTGQKINQKFGKPGIFYNVVMVKTLETRLTAYEKQNEEAREIQRQVFGQSDEEDSEADSDEENSDEEEDSQAASDAAYLEFRSNFNNSVIIVDEAHNQHYKFYNFLDRLSHDPEINVKIVLLTATPAYSKISTAHRLLDILNPAEYQLQDADEEKKQEAFNGVITYLKSSIPHLRKVYGGSLDIAGFPMKLTPSYMSWTVYKGNIVGQAYVYWQYANSTPEDKSSASSAFYLTETRISDFVFPDNTYPLPKSTKTEQNPYHRFINDKGREYSVRDSADGNLLKIFLADRELLRVLSCTNADILDRVDVAEGLCSITMDRKEACKFLGLCFEAQGYSRFRPSPNDIRTDNSKLLISKARRYAYIESKIPTEPVLSVFRHPDNAEGEYIKMLIMSPIGSEGIGLKNVVENPITSSWVKANLYQKESRSARPGMHDDLLDRRAERGLLPPLDVHIPYVAAVLALDAATEKYFREKKVRPKTPPPPLTGQVVLGNTSSRRPKRMAPFAVHDGVEYYSIDVYIYDHAFQRAKEIEPEEEAMQRSTASCHLFEVRNQIECPTQEQPVKAMPYISVYQESARRRLVEYLEGSARRAFLIQDLMRAVGVKRKELTDAIQSLIDDNTVVRDRYGFRKQLAVSGDWLYTSDPYMRDMSSLYAETPYHSTVQHFMRQVWEDALLSQNKVTEFPSWDEILNAGDKYSQTRRINMIKQAWRSQWKAENEYVGLLETSLGNLPESDYESPVGNRLFQDSLRLGIVRRTRNYPHVEKEVRKTEVQQSVKIEKSTSDVYDDISLDKIESSLTSEEEKAPTLDAQMLQPGESAPIQYLYYLIDDRVKDVSLTKGGTEGFTFGQYLTKSAKKDKKDEEEYDMGAAIHLFNPLTGKWLEADDEVIAARDLVYAYPHLYRLLSAREEMQRRLETIGKRELETLEEKLEQLDATEEIASMGQLAASILQERYMKQGGYGIVTELSAQMDGDMKSFKYVLPKTSVAHTQRQSNPGKAISSYKKADLIMIIFVLFSNPLEDYEQTIADGQGLQDSLEKAYRPFMKRMGMDKDKRKLAYFLGKIRELNSSLGGALSLQKRVSEYVVNNGYLIYT